MSPANLPSSGSNFVSLVERYKGVGTIAEAFNLGEPAIAILTKTTGIDKVQAAFRIQLSQFAKDLHIKDTLTEGDIDFIAEQLTTDENYKWLKLADIAILMKRIRMNKYGKLYQSMNTGTFFECLDKYYIERNGEIERLRADEAKQQRVELRGVNLSYYLDENCNIIRKPDYSDEKPKEKKDTDKATRVAHMAKVYVSQGMDYPQAIEKAAAVIEKAENSPSSTSTEVKVNLN